LESSQVHALEIGLYHGRAASVSEAGVEGG
jgi:hypothetical protein